MASHASKWYGMEDFTVLSGSNKEQVIGRKIAKLIEIGVNLPNQADLSY